jgi:hypothetical protein
MQAARAGGLGQRSGISDVALDRVGAVLGLEVSRLARSCVG